MGEINEPRIDKLREELDGIDKELLEKFVKRLDVVKDISRVKKENGFPVFDRRREEQIISNRVSLVSQENAAAVKDFFVNLMELSKIEQRKLYNADEEIINVAYQGVEGSYSFEAVNRYFREGYNTYHQSTFYDVFAALAESSVDYGVLPLENSSTGSIVDVYDLLIRFGFYIVGEEIIAVDHCLLGLECASLDDIDTVFSHEQGLWQCHNFLKQHSSWQQISYKNTAVSAQHVSQSGKKNWAAIAGKQAADYYGLKVLADGIQDQKNNYTRFIIVSQQLRRDDTCNKVSLSFVLKNETGSLANIINIFAENSLNMIKLESRPIPGKPWQYRFYVDIEANLEQDGLQKALTGLGVNSHEWRLLGNYPSAASTQTLNL